MDKSIVSPFFMTHGVHLGPLQLRRQPLPPIGEFTGGLHRPC